MTSRRHPLWAAVVLAALNSGCGGGGDGAPIGREIAFRGLGGGSSASTDQRFLVFRDASSFRSSWQIQWAPDLPVPPVPDVDFSRETVLGVVLGAQLTTCALTGIRRVIDEGTKIRVEYQSFGSGSVLCSPMPTNPSHFVAVPSFGDLPVDFVQVDR